MKVKKCTTAKELLLHYKIRKEVFIDEQNVSFEEEFDLLEDTHIPYILYLNGNVVATSRLALSNKAKIERVAVLKEYRGKGLGKYLMEYLFTIIIISGYKEVHIGAQESALDFYEKLGFKKYGERYMDAGIPHYNMKKELA